MRVFTCGRVSYVVYAATHKHAYIHMYAATRAAAYMAASRDRYAVTRFSAYLALRWRGSERVLRDSYKKMNLKMIGEHRNPKFHTPVRKVGKSGLKLRDLPEPRQHRSTVDRLRPIASRPPQIPKIQYYYETGSIFDSTRNPPPHTVMGFRQ